CDLKHNFAAAARLCFKNCAATLCFKLFFLDSNEPQYEIAASPDQEPDGSEPTDGSIPYE
ncbi:MAG: hypothetical protein AB7R40_25805, partial [Nitrospiraceae bacterium]